MKVSEAIRARRTIRAYQSKEVPEETIKEIIELAGQAPSNCNTQPWHIAVVSGKAKEKLKNALLTTVQSGNGPNPDWGRGTYVFEGVYKDRQYDCAYRYYDSMGVKREDREARTKLFLENWKFFGAPHAAFISMPMTMNEINAIDIGIFLQSLMLLFTERGIACCPQGALANFPDPVKEIAEIPEGNGIIVGISFGYEEKGAQINSAKMPRADLNAIASFTK